MNQSVVDRCMTVDASISPREVLDQLSTKDIEQYLTDRIQGQRSIKLPGTWSYIKPMPPSYDEWVDIAQFIVDNYNRLTNEEQEMIRNAIKRTK